MRHTWTVPGTSLNHALRLLCVWLLLTGPGVLWTGGCSQAPNGSATNSNANGGGNADDNTNGNDNANSDGNVNGNDNVGEGQPPASAFSVDGYWISTREEGGATLRGLATGGQFDALVTLTIAEDDGGAWSFSGGSNGDALEGTCSRSLNDGTSDFGDLFAEPPACSGVFSAGGDTLVLTADDGIAQRTWALQRPSAPSPMLIGCWSESPNASGRMVTAFDGNVLAVLDPGDQSRRFDAVADGAGGFVGTDPNGHRWVGLPTTDDHELFVWVDDFGTFISQRTYARQDEPATFPAPLTGRWMSSYNNGTGTNALRGQASVIFDGEHLYAYQRDDSHRILFESDYARGGYWSIFATFDGERFQSTDESTTNWSGVVDPAGAIIHGHWNDDTSRSFGFVRSGVASPADLTGVWSSVSTDYETPSDPHQTTGQAQVAFVGSILVIEDAYDNADYRIEALWEGDHFEGQWWPVDDPGNRLRWSGEIVLDGALLHGKWEYGEWSLSPFMPQTHQALADAPSDSIAIVGDPFDEILAGYRNDAEDLAVTVYRSEGVVTRYSIVAPGGNVEITVDERSRPLSVVGPDLNVVLTWADDAGSVDLAVEQDGATTAETIAIDLSDAAVGTALTEMESATGVNAEGLRAWIESNPGRLAAVARGEQGISSPDAAFSKLAKYAGATNTAKNATALDVGKRVVTDGATIGGLIWAAVAAGSKVLLAVGGTAAISATVVGAFAGLAILATAAAAFILIVFLFEFIFDCFPCSLGCFWNCRA